MKARLGFFYFAIFAFIGIHMPFWPVWLKSRGIDPVGIAALSALSFALKIIVTPMVSRRVDVSGRKREAAIWLALGLLLGCCLFTFTAGFVQIFLLTLLAFTCWSPIMALGESITTVVAKAERLDYGRIRLWGSISFMLIVAGSGQLLQAFGDAVLLWAIAGAALLLVVATLLLPAGRTMPAAAQANAPALRSNLPFLHSRWFVVVIGATMLIQGSHAAYYTFASIHWREAGLGDQTIGLIWGVSLAAEVAFFAFGRPLVDRLGAVNVLLVGGLAAALRWLVIGATDDPALLALAQLLHAFSFGASHFAAMRLISEKVDDALSASGQGLYSAYVMGLGMGVFVLASGPIYRAIGTESFVAMAAVALLGTAGVCVLRRLEITRIAPSILVDTAAPAASAVGGGKAIAA